jgi:hypothetical protein
MNGNRRALARMEQVRAAERNRRLRSLLVIDETVQRARLRDAGHDRRENRPADRSRVEP